MAGNNKLEAYINEKDTFPRSVSATGTISTGNRLDHIVGSGTLFTTEFQAGDWIFVPGQDGLQRIRSIQSDTELRTVQQFSGSFAAEAFSQVDNNPWRRVGWVVIAGTTALIDGVPVFAGEGVNADKTGGPAMVEMPDPIIIDAPADTVHVSYLR